MKTTLVKNPSIFVKKSRCFAEPSPLLQVKKFCLKNWWIFNQCGFHLFWPQLLQSIADTSSWNQRQWWKTQLCCRNSSIVHSTYTVPCGDFTIHISDGIISQWRYTRDSRIDGLIDINSTQSLFTFVRTGRHSERGQNSVAYEIQNRVKSNGMVARF